jgi:cell fate regulator YaaT (PSP1 superfamily)
MSTLVGVQFKPSDKVQYFDPNGVDLTVGERVIVETWDGEREGVVVIAPEQVLHSDLRGPMNAVLRKSKNA